MNPKGLPKTYLITVALISKNAGPGTFSYFSAYLPRVGQVVRVPVRKKLIEAVVLAVKNARLAKTDIKRSSFALKKISKKDFLGIEIPHHFLEATHATAKYYGSSTGAILASLMPKFVFEHPESIEALRKKHNKRRSPVIKEPLVIQMDKEERFGQYRSIIRQCFARGASILFVAPSNIEAERAFKSLSRGIEAFAYLIDSSTKKKELNKKWHEAKKYKHPILFITTPFGISFDRPDLHTIILERENSRAYRTLFRPYINFKVFLAELTRVSGQEFYLGDSVLSIESLWMEREGKYGEFSPVKWRLSATPTSLVDMKMIKNKDNKEEKAFEVISPELEKLISKTLAEKTSIFLFGTRKGLAPTTICGDCGSVLPCLSCGAPVVLHRREDNIYICHRCGATRDPETACDVCGSWKLTPLGIGTELIAKEVQKKFPYAKVFILDKDHTPTPKGAMKIAREVQEKGGILVGTEQAFYYLERVGYAAVVSVDSLFSLPDFSAEERIFYLISRLREICEKQVLIQTRNIGKDVLSWAAQGNILDFYKKEIEERKILSYPPLSIFIKISTNNPKEIQEHFGKWQPEILKDSLIMRLPREVWPDEELAQKLSLLPPNFSIKVDPESLI